VDVAARFNNFAFWRNSKLEDNDGKLEQRTTEDLHRFYALAQFHKGCGGVTPDPRGLFRFRLANLPTRLNFRPLSSMEEIHADLSR